MLLGPGVVFFAGCCQVETRGSHPLVDPEYPRRRQAWALLPTTLLPTTLLTLSGVFAAVSGLAVAFARGSPFGFGLRPEALSPLLLTPYALVGRLVGPFAWRLAPVLGHRGCRGSGW